MFILCDFVFQTLAQLRGMHVDIPMSSMVSWTLEKSHVRIAFRRAVSKQSYFEMSLKIYECFEHEFHIVQIRWFQNFYQEVWTIIQFLLYENLSNLVVMVIKYKS